MGNRYQSKKQKLEELKEQLKQEEKRVEQNIGKFALKELEFEHDREEEAKEILSLLISEYKESQTNSEKIEHTQQERPYQTVGSSVK
ncbi:hypothetical protein ACFPU1_16755 [Thalassorhabdus alkalitolerans]|uniref:Uncharacterized protein n=1 Tax=Thalassorhabdus alkalitolerans TaxID=2282697 RepID=A0ABW0YT89_9BACI